MASKKGQIFERDFCRELSDWWTHGRNEDVFYRTQGSGARSTNRRKKGRSAIIGQVLDVGAVDPDALLFLKMFLVSLKKGECRGTTIQDLFDKNRTKTPDIHWWIEECELARESVGAYSWMLVFKRDYRDAIVLTPKPYFKELVRNSCSTLFIPKFSVVPLTLLTLHEFYEYLSPHIVRSSAMTHA